MNSDYYRQEQSMVAKIHVQNIMRKRIFTYPQSISSKDSNFYKWENQVQ